MRAASGAGGFRCPDSRADWQAVVTLVRKAGSARAAWSIAETRLIPANRLATSITAGCQRRVS